MELARDLIRHSGLEIGVDVEFDYSGVRPDETLVEGVLFGCEAIRPTSHPKVLCTDLNAADALVLERLGLFVKSALAAEDQEDKLRELLHALVPDFEREDALLNPRMRRSDPAGEIARPRVV